MKMAKCEQNGTQYALSLSYGKDSLACLGAIERLKWPLDRIVHAEVWATDTIHADLPPMIEFKQKVDEIIKSRYGIEVEHICAVERETERRLSFEKQFYKQHTKGKYIGAIYGFPMVRAPWCNSELKRRTLHQCFPRAPLHKERIQILCGISGLP